jgi:Resolvase, N terminal domain/Cornifin (SPRR) family
MTKDLVALSNRARSIAVIALLVAGATIITSPAPARVLVRGFGAFVLPEGLASRFAAFRSLSAKRRRRRDARSAQVAEPADTAVVEPADTTVDEPADTTVDEPAETTVAEPADAQTTTQATAEDSPGRSATGLQAGAPVIGYVTTPAHAVNEDLSPTEQAIERACQRAGWRLVAIVRDPEGGRILDRPGLSHALQQIADGQAEGLVVNDAMLLSRSLDFAGLVNWFRDAEAALIALDLGLDTSTPEGSRVASTLITLNGWAGERIAKRASVAMTNRPELLERIAAMHRDDMPLQSIADRLNSEGERAPSGGHVWWPSTVQTALRNWRATARAPMEELPLERRVSASG